MEGSVTYIYSLSHPITGEVRYVGKADKPKTRLYAHMNDTSQSKKTDWIKSITDLGLKPIVEIIDTVSKQNWTFWESHYVHLYKSWGFNLTNKPSQSSDEKKRKISIAVKKTFQDPQIRQAISNRLKGRGLLDSTKAKLSAINSGEGNPFFGKHLSDKHKENISKSQKGRKFSDESRQRMKEGQLNYRMKLREGLV